MLKVGKMDVYYGNIHAIKGISFEVAQGEIVTLIGANGAGKSTILKSVSGLMRPKAGSVGFLGAEIGQLPPHEIVKRGLAHVPEGRRIFLRMTVRENLEMGSYTQPGPAAQESLDNVYSRFPRLRERQRQQAGTLSGGEQQMLAIGRALMSSPKLLMLDEPSMGLAPLLVDQIFGIIVELRRAGVTILLVEQNARMALSIADRGYVLETGRVVKSSAASELLQDDDVRRAYLGG